MGYGYSVNDERDDGPHFITSAIDMDDMRSPTKSSLDKSTREDGKREVEQYHVV